MPWFKWSKTSASNGAADPTINFSEGQPPGSLNDSARALMAASAKWRDDISGSIVTTGSSTAYAVASNSVFDTLANMNGAMIAFAPHATNTGTSTLNVDTLGAKPLRQSPGVEIPSGTIILGTPYVATYNNSDGAWYLQGITGNPYNIPIGGFMPYLSTTPPNSSFVMPFGQLVSRTTYSVLFGLVSTTFGIGDGTTTFGLPDLRGRGIFGLDNMGGLAASRITVAGGNFDATVLGGTQDRQNKVIATANVPQLAFTGTATGSMTSTQSDYLVFQQNIAGGGGGGAFATTNGFRNVTMPSITPAGTVNTGSANTALPIIPPAMALPYILRII